MRRDYDSKEERNDNLLFSEMYFKSTIHKTY